MQDRIPADFKDRTICVLGLGFVGLTLAAVMASVGFKIIGVEIRAEVRDSFNAGSAHFYEPGLTENLRRAVQSGLLEVHAESPVDCTATVYIITVGTPLGESGLVNHA